jgi:purine-binding chemotaxis protein CheW
MISPRGPGSGELPTSGLADEMIPLLQKRLGMKVDAERTGRGAHAESALLAFAGRIAQGGADAIAEVPEYQFVTFQVGAEEYAVPIARVQEILRVGAITRVPGAPRIVRGVVNVRGRLLAVADLTSLLGDSSDGGASHAIGPDARIVMLDFDGRHVGLLVDRVSYVIKVPHPSLEPSPSAAGAGRHERVELVSGVVVHEGRTILVLDLDRALLSPGEDNA